MSDRERTGARSLVYSAWHRVESLCMFMSRRWAYELGMIDIDGCEYCRHCYKPLALIETQVSLNDPKNAAVTAKLANMAGIAAYSVSIAINESEIEGFKVKRLEPPTTAAVEWKSPAEYADFLLGLRADHGCPRNHGNPVVVQQEGTA